ncbi:hypothetical protein BH10BAC1_BH10BAC1_07260 [soil metagenome]
MKKFLLFFFVFFIGSPNLFCMRGGQITYTYIGSVSSPYKYKITVTTYNKWIGIASVDKCEIQVILGDGDSVIVPRSNGLSINCPSAQDGILVFSDIRKNIYETTHDFPGPGNYLISANYYNRNAGICNIPYSDNQSFYLQSELVINSFLGSNNSPDFSAIPIISDTVGIVEYYNPLVTELDGDSLYYQLIPPMADGVPILGYTFPASSTSFSINPNNGIITWNTPTMTCTWAFALKVSEWRKISGTYYYIGSVNQDGWNRNNTYVGISENNNPTTTLTIFPNPSNGLINYTIESQLQNQNYQMEINNSIGQIIKTIDITSNSGIINESELSSGIYFYSLRNSKEILNNGKFVILQGSMK